MRTQNLSYDNSVQSIGFPQMIIDAISLKRGSVKTMDKTRVKSDLQRLRKRGFYSETALAKLLEKHGYKAVRVPVSNPSRNPLPDVIARRGQHVYAFEVKSASYRAYFPRGQTEKLFGFLDQFIPLSSQSKHAVLAAHFGKRWIFREMSWKDRENGKLAERERILKGDKGNFDLKTGCVTHRPLLNFAISS